MKPFTELMDLILSPLKSAAAQGAQNLASGIGTTVQLGLTLYIILYGWQVARGEIAEPWNEFAKRAVKLGLIVALIQSTGLYQEFVIDFLAGSLPDALSNALSSKPIPDASAFDSLANQVAILLTQVWQGTGWSAPAATARAAVVTLLVMPFLWGALIVGFVVTLWAKAGMYFVATLGPLFIALAMFEQTRKYLHNWLDQIVTMIVLQVLVALTCGLVIQGLDKAVKTAPTPETVFALAGHVIVLAVFSLAIWSSLPRLASKLGGYGASMAGAGSRAAPFETLRTPFGAFNEHGSPPPGRPELATIAPRGGDGRPASAPIIPPPVVSGDGGPGHGGGVASGSPASSSLPPQRVSDPVDHAQTGSTTPTFDGRTGFRSVDATPTSAPLGDTAATAAAGNDWGSAGPPPVVMSTGASAAMSAELHPAGSANLTDAHVPSVAGPSHASAGRSDTHFDTLLADLRTGFEGLDFEASVPRSAEASSRALAAPISVVATRVEPPSAVAPDDTKSTTIFATDGRPS